MEKHVFSEQTGFLSGQNLSLAGQMTCLLREIIYWLVLLQTNESSTIYIKKGKTIDTYHRTRPRAARWSPDCLAQTPWDEESQT